MATNSAPWFGANRSTTEKTGHGPLSSGEDGVGLTDQMPGEDLVAFTDDRVVAHDQEPVLQLDRSLDPLDGEPLLVTPRKRLVQNPGNRGRERVLMPGQLGFEFVATPSQVRNTGLMPGVFVAAVRRPAVTNQHPGVVLAEEKLRVIETATGG